MGGGAKGLFKGVSSGLEWIMCGSRVAFVWIKKYVPRAGVHTSEKFVLSAAFGALFQVSLLSHGGLIRHQTLDNLIAFRLNCFC